MSRLLKYYKKRWIGHSLQVRTTLPPLLYIADLNNEGQVEITHHQHRHLCTARHHLPLRWVFV